MVASGACTLAAFSAVRGELAPFTQARVLEVPLSLEKLLELFGLPYLSWWSGQYQFSLGNVGRVLFEYVSWGAWFYVRATSLEMHMVTVESVTATMVFEDGSTLEAELRDGFPPITLTEATDVNGDRKVAYSVTFTIVASVQKYWTLSAFIDWDSKLGYGNAETYVYTYDLTGKKTGEKVMASTSWGPLKESSTTLSGPSKQATFEWQLEGLEPITGKGGIRFKNQ